MLTVLTKGQGEPHNRIITPNYHEDNVTTNDFKVAATQTAPPVVNWGGPSFPSYDGRMETPAAPSPAAAPAATPSAAPTSPGGTGASPTPGGGTASPAPGSAPASPAGGGTAPTLDWKNAPEQLRTAYEIAAKALERWNKLGADPDQVESAWTSHQASVTKATEVGTALGYTAQQVADAVAKHGVVTTMNWLNQKTAEVQAGRGQGEEEDPLDSRLRPVEEFIAKQNANAANARFTTEFKRLIDSEFAGDKALPNEVNSFLFNITSELFKYDRTAMENLASGKISDVQKYFDKARTKVLTVFNAWKAAEEKRQPAPPPGTPGGTEKPKFNLNDIIEGNDKAKGAISAFR